MFRVGFAMLLAAAAFAGPQDTCTLNAPLRSGGPRPPMTVNTIVLHHTAIASLGNSLGTLRSRRLSYHYLIDSDGTIVRAVSPERVAFHAAGANRGSIGISFVGGNRVLMVANRCAIERGGQADRETGEEVPDDSLRHLVQALACGGD